MFFYTLSAFLFVCANATRCREVYIFDLLDCSDLGLETIRGLWKTERDWVLNVDFWKNRFVTINVTELLDAFPNLRHIDLHKNPEIDCRAIRNLRIRTRSYCKFVSFVTQHT
jgi:hypothetical protein